MSDPGQTPRSPTAPGVDLSGGGAVFTLYSPDAAGITLMLFDRAEDGRPARELEARPAGDGWWRCEVPGAGAGQLYLYRARGEAPWFRPEAWLLDPRAMAVEFARGWGDRTGLRAGRFPAPGPRFPKGVVIDHAFDWGDDRPPRTPWEDTVLYELHVRGFTRGRGADVRHPGTYRGLVEKIPYLCDLGVTAVELLPIQEFNELEFFHEGGARRDLLNFWGYSTLAFFAPQTRYAAAPTAEGAVREVKDMVRALHAAGIEVILDVVFNHTAEGDATGPTYSFRGLAPDVYYLRDAEGGYLDFTGCGNTVNANGPAATAFFVDCLRHWVEHYHVDGFRFDLAAALARGAPGGRVLPDPPLLRAIDADPVLRRVKRIAEAWDATGHRLVGGFPGRGWTEWNDRFRDDARGFWCGHGVPLGSLATRWCGSADLFGHGGREPAASVNMATCHDGFTLADLVRYAHKHNEANAEQNRDGSDGNFSANHGVEGPSRDPAVEARRLATQVNLLATLLLSAGTPHLLAGDEFGQSQHGNNNAYCQDGDLAWLDWTGIRRNPVLHEAARHLLALRRTHGALRRKRFFSGDGPPPGDIAWYGPAGAAPDWRQGRAFACRIDGRAAHTGRAADEAALLLAVNAGPEPAGFTLPPEPGGRWRLAWHTPQTAFSHGGTVLQAGPCSVAVLVLEDATAGTGNG